MCFTPQISLLVDVFIQETGVELVEVYIAACWGQPLEVLHQKDGMFTEVISCLDELAQCMPSRKAWDELVFLPPAAESCQADIWDTLWAALWTSWGVHCPSCSSTLAA